MGSGQMLLILAGALAGGFVNGLTGFGTGITALGIWLYVVSPPVATSLVVVCATIAQIQTLPMIWRSIEWERALRYTIPGLIGVPLGTLLLPLIDQRSFKIGAGTFLVLYPAYVLSGRARASSAWGGRAADGAVGFAGGVMAGLAGLSAVLPIVWTDIRGLTKEGRRSLLQVFNLGTLGTALASHAIVGLLSREVGLAVLVALPGTVGGALAGALVYRRLGNRGFQQVVMALLFVSGLMLIWTSL
jgi:hypothetical protein